MLCQWHIRRTQASGSSSRSAAGPEGTPRRSGASPSTWAARSTRRRPFNRVDSEAEPPAAGTGAAAPASQIDSHGFDRRTLRRVFTFDANRKIFVRGTTEYLVRPHIQTADGRSHQVRRVSDGLLVADFNYFENTTRGPRWLTASLVPDLTYADAGALFDAWMASGQPTIP